MKKHKIIAIILILLTVALSVVAYIFLPDYVITQFSAGGNTTQMPKLFAVCLPLILGVGGSIACFISKEEGKSRTSSMIVAGAGLLLLVIMLLVNI